MQHQVNWCASLAAIDYMNAKVGAVITQAVSLEAKGSHAWWV
jgi:uncharacterized Ntn-hydrolase superfamily protein